MWLSQFRSKKSNVLPAHFEAPLAFHDTSKYLAKTRKLVKLKPSAPKVEIFSKKGFFDIQNDPNWVTEDRSDSNSKFGGNGGWAMNIAEEEMPNLSSVSISGGEDSEDDNDDFFAVGNGIKRKAAIVNEQSTKDSSDEKGYCSPQNCQQSWGFLERQVFEGKLSQINISILETTLNWICSQEILLCS